MDTKDSVVSLLWANYKIIIIAFIVLVIAIPIGSYAISWRIRASQTGQSQGYNQAVTAESSSSATKKKVSRSKSDLDKASNKSGSADTEKEGVESSAKVSFGPTLDFSILIEGRPKDNYTTKLFVGIAEGKPTAIPKYLLQFNVDVPKTGVFTGMSLQGLDEGKTYSAYLKGPAQIATASAFTLNASANKLNSGTALQLLTGDLNEDNTINTADYSIAKAALGANPSFANWNANIDFNLDGVINAFDLAFITKNFGKSGLSGAWYSPTPSAGSPGIATPSAGTSTEPIMDVKIEMPPIGKSGYWIWVPPKDD